MMMGQFGKPITEDDLSPKVKIKDYEWRVSESQSVTIKPPNRKERRAAMREWSNQV